jgi:hypothetical protein
MQVSWIQLHGGVDGLDFWNNSGFQIKGETSRRSDTLSRIARSKARRTTPAARGVGTLDVVRAVGHGAIIALLTEDTRFTSSAHPQRRAHV